MIYHSIIPYEVTFAMQAPDQPVLPYLETIYKGVTMQVSGGKDGIYKIERICSTDPKAFLAQDLQIGREIMLQQ